MLSNRLFAFGRQIVSSNLIQNSLRSVAFSSTLNQPKSLELSKPVDNVAICKEVFAKVNNKLDEQSEGRLFAVIHLCGKQFKVTAGDIIVVEGYWPPTIGDKIRLDKVLVAGGDDFSLIGRPLVQSGLVDVQATVIEKTISHTRTQFRKKRRKQYTNIKFHRSASSMIRINSIEVNGRIDENIPEESEERVFH